MKDRMGREHLYMLVYADQYERDDANREGPIVRLRKTYDGDYVLFMSSNLEVNPPLSPYQFQQMEFLGFTIPRTAKGDFAIDPKKHRGSTYSNFHRILKGPTSMVKVIDTILSTLVVVYGADVYSWFYFGPNIGTTRFVHKLDKLDRYQASEGNPKAEIFGFKGMHDVPLFGSKVKSKNEK